MTLSGRFLVGVSVAFALFLESNAYAGPWLSVTACDSVAIDGVYHPRMTFSVKNVSGWAVISIQACSQEVGAPTDSCTALVVTAPAAWRGRPGPCGAAWFQVDPFDESYIAPGQTLGGFQVVVDRPSCCFEFAFRSWDLEPFAFDTLCFSCEQAVAARSVSWGQIKSQYR